MMTLMMMMTSVLTDVAEADAVIHPLHSRHSAKTNDIIFCPFSKNTVIYKRSSLHLNLHITFI